MPREPLGIVLRYRDTAKPAFNVLVGALEQDPLASRATVLFADRRAPLEAAVARALERFERVLVCWSFYSPGFGAIARELAAVRAAAPDPRALHVAGGVHATAEPRATLAAGFDLAALGEGERVFQDLVRALLEGRDPRDVAGVASLAPDGSLRAAGRGFAGDLDPWPPFAPRHKKLGPIEITRGCIYACKFCQTPFMSRARFRHRSLENVLGWVRFQKERGFRDYRFITPTSLSYGADGEAPRLDRVEALLAGVRGIVGREARIFYGTFPSEIRPEHVSREALVVIARWADNRSVIIGGQSGSDAVLEAAGRGHDTGAIERAVAIAVEAGFEPHVDFIFGLPGEDEAGVAATLALAERLAARGARIHGHTFMPLPGTPWRDAAPGEVSAAARARLARLTGTRRLYGEWERQAALARDLAAARGPRA
jgi:B12-binding domain/radical SAM domain protein